ncbi:hypothetical protein E1B28_011394 [Marasmius oreades]|uniref:Cytochrome P450 n=1 Tax=Marasmius oreades TaxID=181124 RepID=A0A9P7RUR3_9AGAR|nr:uncharacterized protein E1B28_011394 [Marasmius oreades]KAG7089740.1 hypothetical protein E1B28_011394 [Marasmius oreades]
MPMRLDFSTAITYLNLGVALGLPYAFYMYFTALRKRALLEAIPTVGHDGIFTSYITIWRYLFDGRALIEEGCRKYPGSAFKIPTIDGWQVVVNGHQMYDGLRRASEDELSTFEALDDLFKARYTMSPHLNDNPYHVDVILTSLTRNTAAKLDDIRDEIRQAFQDFIPATEDWTEYSNLPKLMPKIVVRVSNRVFVGLPLCRNKDWCDLNVKFTISVAVNALVIGLFPKFLHPIVGRIFSSRRSSLRRATKHLSSILKERMETESQNHGSGVEQSYEPNDLLSWLVDKREKIGEDWQKASVEDLSLRVIAINFAAIHTTSGFFTHALYDLAANPQLADPLRDEFTSVIESEGGWTKSAMSKMYMLDSFLKESARKGVASVSVIRIALQDFMLPNGIRLPTGTKVGIAAYHTHHSEKTYPAPDTFQVARFAEKGGNTRNCMTTLSEDWLTFGTGKHACPGRFFAVNQLKMLMGYVLLTYDVKFSEKQANFPHPLWFANTVIPNSSARVMFRRRKM